MRLVVCLLVALGTSSTAAERVTDDGAVLLGPRIAGRWVVWIEYPKTLVVASGAERTTLALPMTEAPVVDLAPFVDGQGGLVVALIESGVRRPADPDETHRRVSLLTVAGGQRRIVADIAEQSDEAPPERIVGVGLTAMHEPAVLWRARNVATLSTPSGGAGTIVDSRTATAATWRADGVLLYTAEEAGRPTVVEPLGETSAPVPTPAAYSALVLGRGPVAWYAAGIDGAGRVFVSVGSERSAARAFLIPTEPLVAEPTDLLDAGALAGIPRVVVEPQDALVFFPIALDGRSQLRVRAVDEDGDPLGPSRAVLRCPTGTRLAAYDVTSGMAAARCEARGRADVYMEKW